MPIKFQDLTRLHETIYPELLNVFEQTVKKSSFIQGAPVQSFEKSFAEYTGASHCLGVGNGTDAIEIALEALGIGPGDHVVIPSMTFAATAEAVARCGAVPVLVDVDPSTLCLTAETLEQAIAASPKKPRAVMPVHIYGRACDMTGIMSVAKEHGLLVLEDCAQAHGAKHAGRGVGTFGDIGTFSFYPGKNLGALGDGGAIVTNTQKLHDKMKMIRDHGRVEKYTHTELGRNSRLDAMQAGFLSVKLERLPQWTKARRKLARVYAENLKGISGIEMLPLPENEESHVYHLLVIRVTGGKTREKLAVYLGDKGIETGVHYPLGLHQQPAFARYAPAGGLPITEKASKEILSLPMDPLMTEQEARDVCSAIRSF